MSRPTKRSRAYWIWGFVFLMLLHAVAIFRYGERDKFEPPWKRPSPFLHVAGDSATDRVLAEIGALRDPTLFALPQPAGFSGGAWLKFEPEPPVLTNWSAPPEWLALPNKELGASLLAYVSTNKLTEEPLLASLRPPSSIEVRLPSEPIMPNTVARVEGPLVARKLLRAPQLPGVAYSDVLRPTAVTVNVNGEGFVEGAVVVRRSGSTDADNLAIELAKKFEFGMLPIRSGSVREAAPPTLGQIVFSWLVLPPTNAMASVNAAP